MRLRHYLQAIAASNAGTPALKTLIDASGIERNTANAYDAMLERLLITERLPAWSSNRLNRLIRLPKRYLVDPSFVGPLLGVDARAVLRDGDLLGRLLDSFVMALHTGPRPFRFDESIIALPICALWG
jgi:predicted AAA+ superfamily ATPase